MEFVDVVQCTLCSGAVLPALGWSWAAVEQLYSPAVVNSYQGMNNMAKDLDDFLPSDYYPCISLDPAFWY